MMNGLLQVERGSVHVAQPPHGRVLPHRRKLHQKQYFQVGEWHVVRRGGGLRFIETNGMGICFFAGDPNNYLYDGYPR